MEGGLHSEVSDRQKKLQAGYCSYRFQDKRRLTISSQVFARLVKMETWAAGVGGELLPLDCRITEMDFVISGGAKPFSS